MLIVFNSLICTEGSYSIQRINLFEPENRTLPHYRSSKPTIMSEREVREIMHQYNGSIDSFTKEITDLKSKWKELNELKEVLCDEIANSDQNAAVKNKMQISFCEKEKKNNELKDIEHNIEMIKDLKEYSNKGDFNTKKKLQSDLKEMLPDSENNDVVSAQKSVIDELFNNYSSTLQRLEQLKEENQELNRKNDQERLFQDIQNLNRKLNYL